MSKRSDYPGHLFVANSSSSYDGGYRLKKKSLNGHPAWEHLEKNGPHVLMWSDTRDCWGLSKTERTGLERGQFCFIGKKGAALPTDVRRWFQKCQGQDSFAACPVSIQTEPDRESESRKTRAAELFERVTAIKEAGNKALRDGNFEGAESEYSSGLEQLGGICFTEVRGPHIKKHSHLQRDLCSNRAAVRLKVGNWQGCVDDCNRALKEDCDHVKSLFRCARANKEMGMVSEARVKARGAALLWDSQRDGSQKEVQALLKSLDDRCGNAIPTVVEDTIHPYAMTPEEHSCFRALEALRYSPDAHASSVPLRVRLMRSCKPDMYAAAESLVGKFFPFRKRADSFSLARLVIRVSSRRSFEKWKAEGGRGKLRKERKPWRLKNEKVKLLEREMKTKRKTKGTMAERKNE